MQLDEAGYTNIAGKVAVAPNAPLCVLLHVVLSSSPPAEQQYHEWNSRLNLPLVACVN